MNFPPNVFPFLLILSPTITTFIQILLNLSQYFHLISSKDSNYHNINSYYTHLSTIDSIKYDILSSMISLFSSLIIIFSVSELWNRTKTNLKFFFAYLLIMFVLNEIPQIVLKIYFLHQQNINFFELVVSQAISYSYTSAGEGILLLVVYYVAKKTQLEETHIIEDQENGQRDDETINNNTDANNNHPQIIARNICTGKFWLIFLIVGLFVVFLINIFAVDFIMIDTDNFTRLDNLEIIKAIKNLTESVNFPYEYVYMQKTGSPNAFFTGITKKRIVIVKSLIDILKKPIYLCAVVAHELGHWAHKDSITLMFLSLLSICILSGILYSVSKTGLSSIGLGREMPFLIFLLCCSMISEFPILMLMFIINLLTRLLENRADCYSAKLGYPIVEALALLTNGVSNEIESAPLYSLLTENHPSLSKRAEYVSKCLMK